ncbi:hypothetical protein [Haladaptatus sp. DYSN1]|uniref:hypothetical protein n=1 Tax=unclassified Haladaptatus TaxID=2622732 RepID=UPI002406E0FA|nr:hypothetical protein [Haladaptatus sp. DYSN1]
MVGGAPTVLGLFGGLLVAVVFTLLFELRTREFTLPTTPLWNRYVGPIGVGRLRVPGASVLHLLVGALAGGLFPSLVTAFLGVETVYLSTFPQALTAGLGYGLAMYAAARVAELLGLVDLVAPAESRLLFEYHVLYGLGLGTWFGLSQWLGYPVVCTLFETVCTGA